MLSGMSACIFRGNLQVATYSNKSPEERDKLFLFPMYRGFEFDPHYRLTLYTTELLLREFTL